MTREHKFEQMFDGMADFGVQDLVDLGPDDFVLFGSSLPVAVNQLLACERLSTTHDSRGP